MLRCAALLLHLLLLAVVGLPAVQADDPGAAISAPDDPWVLSQIVEFVHAQEEPVTAYDLQAAFAPYARRSTGPTFGSEASTGVLSVLAGVTALSSTHFVVVYANIFSGFAGTAVVGEVSGSSITYGTPSAFNNANTLRLSVDALSSTHFVVTYADQGNSSQGTAIVGQVSGTTISYGSEQVFNAATTDRTAVAALSSTHFVVAYREAASSASQGTAIVGQVSGTSITSFGTASTFNAAATGSPSVAALSASLFVVGYVDEGNADQGTTVVGQVSGGSITSYGSEQVFNAAGTKAVALAPLSSTHFVAAYADEGNNSYGTARVGAVSGTTASYGAERVFNTASTDLVSVSALSSSSFALAYYEGSFTGGTCQSGSCTYQSRTANVSGTTVTAHSDATAVDDSQGSGNSIGVAALNSFVVVYSDMDGTLVKSRFGTGGVLPVELTYFRAQRDGVALHLQWGTASETNNAGFYLEQQPPATEAWQEVAFIEGHGTTLAAQTYRHSLTSLEPGMHRFRLRQVDYDGSTEYSPQVEVEVEMATQYALSETYPNPFNPEATFSLSVQQWQDVRITVHDVLGREVSVVHQGALTADTAHRFMVDADSWPSGMYTLRVVGERFHATQTLTLLR